MKQIRQIFLEGESPTSKFTEELCVMTMQYGAKFEKELTCYCKIDMSNLTNFDLSTRKSPKFAL